MNVLITGANGLVGNQVVNRFLQSGHKVSVIVRSAKNIFFDKNKVSVFIGNFTHYDDLKQAAFHCDVIVHSAAVTNMGFLKYSDYERINFSGTLNVLRVAEELQIKRIIYISTSNTIGNGTEKILGDENNEMAFPFTESFYAQSKKAAENVLLTQNRVEVVILNLCFVASFSPHNVSSSRLINYGYKKRILFVPKGGKNFVRIDKVAEAVFQSAFYGENKEKYLICGENLTYKEFFTKMATVSEYKQTQFEIFSWILKLAGLTGDFLRKIGVKTELCSMNISQLLENEYYNGEKADNRFKLNNFDLIKFLLTFKNN